MMTLIDAALSDDFSTWTVRSTVNKWDPDSFTNHPPHVARGSKSVFTPATPTAVELKKSV